MEDDIEVLKHLAARAILEFENVRSKYKGYFEKFNKEKSERKKLDVQFKKLEQASLLAVAEYEVLHKQYTEVVEENQEIRKQNLTPNITITSASGTAGTKEELEALRTMKDAVTEELRKTKNELNIVKEELKQEKSAHETTMNRFKTGVQQIHELNKVYILAINELQGMKKKFGIESSYCKRAEDGVKKMKDLEEQLERFTQNDQNIKVGKEGSVGKLVGVLAALRQERQENQDPERVRVNLTSGVNVAENLLGELKRKLQEHALATVCHEKEESIDRSSGVYDVVGLARPGAETPSRDITSDQYKYTEAGQFRYF